MDTRPLTSIDDLYERLLRNDPVARAKLRSIRELARRGNPEARFVLSELSRPGKPGSRVSGARVGQERQEQEAQPEDSWSYVAAGPAPAPAPAPPAGGRQPVPASPGSYGLDPRALALHDAMRKLWLDHVAWTRMYLISKSAATRPEDGLPDLQVTTARLTQNQEDIGRALAQFYGQENGAEATRLLKEHIDGADKIVTNAKALDLDRKTEGGRRKTELEAEASSLKDAWEMNARKIAAFLYALNSRYWDQRALEDMMRRHLELTTREVKDRLAGKYVLDVKDYEAVVGQIIEMADVLSQGILRQQADRVISPGAGQAYRPMPYPQASNYGSAVAGASGASTVHGPRSTAGGSGPAVDRRPKTVDQPTADAVGYEVIEGRRIITPESVARARQATEAAKQARATPATETKQKGETT